MSAMNNCNTNVNYDLESTTMFESERDQFIPTSTNKKTKFIATPLALGLASLFGCAVLALTIFGFVKCCEKSENLKGNHFPSLRAGATSLFGGSSAVADDSSADTSTYQQQPQIIYAQPQPGATVQYVNADGTVVDGADEGYTVCQIVGISIGSYCASNFCCTCCVKIAGCAKLGLCCSSSFVETFIQLWFGNFLSCNIAACNSLTRICCNSFIYTPNEFGLCSC